MKNYKVLIITDYAAPYEGNFIESLKLLQKKMEEKGNEVIYLFTPKAKDKGCINGLLKENRKVLFGSDNIKKNMKIIKNIIREEQISIIYTHFCSLKTQVQVKLIRLMNRKVKLISHFHNHYKLSGKFPRKQLAYIAYKGDLNIACSESVKNSIPYSKKKTVYVDNAINFKRLDTYRDIKIDGLENKFVVLMFGFDYYRKGVDISIKAIKELNIDDVVLAISLSKNRDVVEKNIISDFGEIPKFIKFLEPIDDIATYYKKADIFLTSSREEGLCYSVIEAAYCKTKIVCSNIPGVPKNIPGEIFFESTNYVELKNIIYQSIKSDEPDYIKEEAHDYVKRTYSIEKWVKSITRYIEDVNIYKNVN